MNLVPLTHIFLFCVFSLYLDAQLGGLVTSLIHRGNPLNFTLNSVNQGENEADLTQEAGEWRLLFHRECQFTDYLGARDKEGNYSGFSYKVTLDRVKDVSIRCLT